MQPPKLYINARFLTHTITGVERYAIELLSALDQQLAQPNLRMPSLQIEMLAPPGTTTHIHFKNIPLRTVGKLQGHLWEQIELPSYSANGLLFCPCNTGPILKLNKITTIHDASVYTAADSYSIAFKLWYRILLPLLGWTGKKVITVSNFAQQDIHRYFRIPTKKMVSIYHGADHIDNGKLQSELLQSLDLETGKYILSIGSFTKNRNFTSVIEAMPQLVDPSIKYVAAGANLSEIFGDHKIQSQDNVILLKHADINELKTLYSNALCTVVPSFYDSFGFPALESLRCGTPVVASDSAALPEVCGAAALYCSPSNPSTIAECINTLLQDNQSLTKLRQHAPGQANKFTWEQCAKETYKIICGEL